LRQGKSFALNSGIKEAQGKVLAFIDDEVIAAPNWLSNLTAHLLDGSCAGAGERIFPQWNVRAPKWLPLVGRFASGPLVMFDLGSGSGPLLEAPIGTNMAFRKKMFDKYGPFRLDLGPRPGNEIRAEDSEFASRLLRAGEQLRYEPTAVVYHPVPQNRIRKEYFLDWWFDKARAGIRAAGIAPETEWKLAGTL
jgi:cellulose synthase/poly-beta-1,6-N-acetylglucosamine synthase-like glycosyltransferase